MAAGYFGFATAVGAFYTGVAELINEEYGRHVLPGLKPLYTPERLVLTPKAVQSLIIYDRKSNTALLQFRGLQIRTHEDVAAIEAGVKHVIHTASTNSIKCGDAGKVHVIVDYNDTVIADDVADEYWAMTKRLQKKYYKSVTRFAVTSFGTGQRAGPPEHTNDTTAAAQQQLVLNQLQSLQTLSRLVTPAASNISDTDDNSPDDNKQPVRNRQHDIGLSLDDKLSSDGIDTDDDGGVANGMFMEAPLNDTVRVDNTHAGLADTKRRR